MKDKEIEQLTLDGWPLPDEYLIELGRIASLWGSFEAMLNTVPGKLSKFDDVHDPTPFIIFSHASLPQRFDIFGALCEQLEPAYPHLKNYTEVVKKMRSAQSMRNRFMHNGIAFNEELNKYQMGIGSARGKIKTKIEDVRLVDIRRASIEIEKAHRALFTLIFKRELEPVWKRKTEPDH